MIGGSSYTLYCLNCNRPETDFPLVSLRYSGQQAWICSQCLPILIHHPEKLAGRLSEGETMDLSPNMGDSEDLQ